MSDLPGPPGHEVPAGTSNGRPADYAGLATRAISFTIDAALVTVVDIILGVGAALILSFLHIPHELRTILAVIGAVLYFLGSVAYFAIFWSTTGQTPGARVMQIRVLTSDRKQVKPRWALVRCVGVVLAALPLFAGFVPVLFDGRRRAFQDRLARTVVVEVPQLSIAQLSRARRRAAYDATRQLSRGTPDEPAAGSETRSPL